MLKKCAAGSSGARTWPGRALSVIAMIMAGVTMAGVSACGGTRQGYSSSGLERQVINGERVSAATRAQAARHETDQLVMPAPAALTGKVAGAHVTAVGDSVMAACAMALAKVLPGVYIDAKPSRQMPAGLAVLRRLASRGALRQVVVVALGTNYIVTTRQLDQLLGVIGPQRRLVLVNTYVPDEWSKQVNATDARFARRHPSVVLADWFDTIRNRMYLLWPDHIHPEMRGTGVYARLLYRAVQATLRPVGVMSPRGL